MVQEMPSTDKDSGSRFWRERPHAMQSRNCVYAIPKRDGISP